YTSHTSGNPFIGAPTLSRIDPTINFDFGTGSPDPLISSNTFSARWLGQIQALDGDNYTFYTTSDDGVRLWLNGQLIINSWINQAPTEHSNTVAVALAQNTKYDAVMEYYENTGGAVARLSWSTAGGGVVKEIVPQSQLYPAAAGVTQPTLGY